MCPIVAEAVIASRLSLGRFVGTSEWCEGGRLASLFIGMVSFFHVQHRAPLKLLGELTESSMSTTILICHSLLIPLLVLLLATNSLRLSYRPSLLAARFSSYPEGDRLTTHYYWSGYFLHNFCAISAWDREFYPFYPIFRFAFALHPCFGTHECSGVLQPFQSP
ncbi:hypothetical protein EDB84DRAFT_4809 [Lactarius hengduanensis]|nr:hypothetical protein EDB84DRAFT_4809 [Lactarius hengduanensis]